MTNSSRAQAQLPHHVLVRPKCAGVRRQGSRAPVGTRGSVTFSPQLELRVLEHWDVRLIGREKAKI